MATLLSLPNELISAICGHDHSIVPKLRATCRQLNKASLFVFKKAFFEEVTVLAHNSSLRVLGEIARHPVLGPAVKTLAIDANGIFDQAMQSEHHTLITHGVIRDQLIAILPKLANCTKLVTPRWRSDDYLGFCYVNPHFEKERVDVYLNQDNAKWMTKEGFGYPSYVLCDILHAIYTTHHRIEDLDLGGMFLEYGPLGQYLKQFPLTGSNSHVVNRLTIELEDTFWHGGDLQVHITTEALNRSFGPATEVLQSLFDGFPSLQQVYLENGLHERQPFFPSNLPSTLRKLQYLEDHHDTSEAASLLQSLQVLRHLEELDVNMGFESLNHFREFLTEISTISTLRQLRVAGTICDDQHVHRSHIVIGKCMRRPDAFHELFTDRVHSDIPIWCEEVYECSCHV